MCLITNSTYPVSQRGFSFHRLAKLPAPPTSPNELIQQGGAGGFACRFNGHNQWSASKLNKFPKTVKHPPVKGDIHKRWDQVAERVNTKTATMLVALGPIKHFKRARHEGSAEGDNLT